MSLFRYPNSKVWWFDFIYRGRRHRRSTHTRSRDLAARVERKHRRNLEEGLNGLEPAEKPKCLAELYEELLENKRAHWAEKTFETNTESWGHLQQHFGRKYAYEIEAGDIATYRDGRKSLGVSPHSINREIALLRALLCRANRWNSIRRDYQPLHIEEQSGVALNQEEEDRLIAACQLSKSLALRVVIVVALSTGMRYTELRKLRWAQIDIVNGYIIVTISKTAAGRGRRIPLPPRALRALGAWTERFPNRQPNHYVFCHERYGMKNHLLTEHLSYDTNPERPMGSFNNGWRLAKKRAGLKLRFHDLRHTVVTKLLTGGTPFNTVALMMGWSASNTVLMIRKYGHLVDKSLKKAATLLDGAEKPDHHNKSDSTAAPSGAGDSRKEEPTQNDAAAGDPSAKKGGSSEEE